MFCFLIKYIILYMMRANNIVISSIGAEYIWQPKTKQFKYMSVCGLFFLIFLTFIGENSKILLSFCCCKWLWRYSRMSRECGDAGSIPSCFKCQNIFEQISVRPWSEKSKSGKLSEKSISTNRNSQLITTSTNFWKRCTRVGHKRGDQMNKLLVCFTQETAWQFRAGRGRINEGELICFDIRASSSIINWWKVCEAFVAASAVYWINLTAEVGQRIYPDWDF